VLADAQRAILNRSAAAVRPGGVLVYSTCTLLPEENEAVVESFLEHSNDFVRASEDDVPEHLRSLIGSDGFLRCFPHHHDTDGFFAARLERRS
jgi:16S rRNA (cytosine967-C5)-methyltransferase